MKLIQGDCLEAMQGMPADSVDAIVTDPPYGWRFMGKAWDGKDIDEMALADLPRVGELKMYSDGKMRKRRLRPAQAAGKYDLSANGNEAFQIFSEEWALEAFRVLKPGGHALIFCGPRTYHRMACGVEDAGFEIRDQLQWLFGSGFPKSLDISKAIDKAAGAEREVVGISTIGGGGASNKKGFATDGVRGSGGSYQQASDGKSGLAITPPSTDAAKLWEGWGTALKPANEPILLARKPLSEKTVAANVLKWGTGGINVEGCRIPTDWSTDPTRRGWQGKPGSGTNQCDGMGFKNPVATGRFPSNLLLDEAAAEMLDEQSGQSKSPLGIVTGTKCIGGIMNSGHGRTESNTGFGDTGGASRFFYVAKTSKRERNAGLDRTEIIHVSVGEWECADLKATLQVDMAQFPPRVIGASGTLHKSVSEWNTCLFGSGTSEPLLTECTSTTKTATNSITESKTLNWLLRWNTSASILAASLSTVPGGSHAEAVARSSQSPTTTSGTTVTLTSASDAQSTERLQIRSAGTLKSTHPTVKPLKLMRYLCRLITPAGGTVLDPFMGSGTTGIAALQEQFDFIGIEREAEYMEIAKRRIEYFQEEPTGE